MGLGDTRQPLTGLCLVLSIRITASVIMVLAFSIYALALSMSSAELLEKEI